MELEIKVNINGLDQLTEALALIGSALAYQKGMINTADAAVNLMLDVTDKVEDLTEETPELKKEEIKVKEEPKEVVAEEPPSITIEQVRAAFMAKNSKGNTEKLKSILKDFGVKKVTDLEEKDFPAVLKALEEI
ncbi:hypothetical protein [Tissierella sp.]|uniref:hypothetical protein n=1 Tax=Tissierella sp. TaxID=41274 RepID=UPI0028B0BB8F|nr:hypothetical protein [Tissierella sp.]